MTSSAVELFSIENPLRTGRLFRSEKVLDIKEASALYRAALDQERLAQADVDRLMERRKEIDVFLAETMVALTEANQRKEAAADLVEEAQELVLMLAEKEDAC